MSEEIEANPSHTAFQDELNALVKESGVGQEVFGMVLARTSLRAPDETSRWHLERGSDARPVDRRVLPQATVSKAVKALTTRGFLEEGTTHQKSGDGRAVAPLRFGQRILIAGVHVEQRRKLPRTITVALVGLDTTRVLMEKSHALEAADEQGWEGAAQAIQHLVIELKEALDEARKAEGSEPFALFGVGVDIGAPVYNGKIVPVPGLADHHTVVDFQKALQQAFTDELGQSVPVVVENDVNALAVLAIHEEHYAVPDLVVISVFDEGVGGGLVMDGRLRRGGNGTAMEVGHLPVAFPPGDAVVTVQQGDLGLSKNDQLTFNDPCWCNRYGHVDTRATPSRLQGELGTSTFDEAARLTSTRACEVFETAGSVLGRAAAHVCNIVNPSRLIVMLPAILAEPPSDAAAAEYRRAAEAEIVTAFGNRGRDPDQFLRFAPFPGEREEIAVLCARAAAVCVLQAFIEHALRVDGCKFEGTRQHRAA
ncbi:ROK family protein [Mycobacterium paraense]|uniref:ROK family protein n=1 Tax=Mycobacterium paraense TaxID=767916 RepID=UPI00111BDDD3|nr:ROK family protein [Mycobacterium paraense]